MVKPSAHNGFNGGSTPSPPTRHKRFTVEKVVWEIRTPANKYGPFESWNDAVKYMLKEQIVGFIVTNKVRDKDETTSSWK